MLWLYGVARNVVTREWRSAGRRRRLGARLAFRRQPAVPIPEDVLVDDDETRRVLDAAGRLNDSDAEVLRLLAWEHLTPAELATVLEITPNAVHQRLHRAKRNLVREYDRPDVVPVRSPAAPEGGA